MSDLLASVGADPMRPQDVAKQLGVNKNLTWKVSKIIRETDPGMVVPQVPGKEGFRILLRATRRSGAPADLIDLAEDAIARFDDLIETHTGDRDTLELMAGHLSDEIDPARAETERKLSFRGNSSIWGAQARMQLCVNIIAPSDDPDWADLAWISGLVDFTRLRADVNWTIASARKANDAGSVLPLGDVQALDPKFGDGHTAPLLGDWCSQPIPNVAINAGPDGMVRYQLLEGRVGHTAAATCVIGILGPPVCPPHANGGRHDRRAQCAVVYARSAWWFTICSSTKSSSTPLIRSRYFTVNCRTYPLIPRAVARQACYPYPRRCNTWESVCRV